MKRLYELCRLYVFAGLFAGIIVSCDTVFAQGYPSPKGEKLEMKNATTEGAKEHPLMPVLRWVESGRPDVVKIKDYTAILSKQERINGKLQEAQMMEIKIRHEPLSVYLNFIYPKAQVGKEAIWVKGKNDNKVIGHGVGAQKIFGTQFLEPDGTIAMLGNKYPITDIGFLNLVDKLAEVGREDVKYGECEVVYYENIKYDERECTVIQVKHPVPRKNFRFYIARIFVDNELNLPIRYESYDWPKKEGDKPPLLEMYAYQQIKINPGLSDKDFEHDNPDYGYGK